MAQDTKHHKRLTRIQVDGLIGRFDYDIRFNPEWRFLILHGPNGVGKTRLLELLHSAFSGRYLRLINLPFDSARFDFDDGTSIEVNRGLEFQQESLLPPPHRTAHLSKRRPILTWKIASPQHKTVTYKMVMKITQEERRLIARIEHRYPVERLGFDLWLDLTTNEELGLYELAERYGLNVSSASSPDDIA